LNRYRLQAEEELKKKQTECAAQLEAANEADKCAKAAIKTLQESLDYVSSFLPDSKYLLT